jgi:MerR family Zn(II)-responsive transcriptional regulator of zntA
MLTIGKLSSRAGSTPDALRFYEREGLLKPAAKSAGGYRLYEESAVQRLRFIHQAKQCGFTLAEIQALLNVQSQRSACCGDVRGRVVEKKLQLEARIRIRAMQAMSKALDVLIADCSAGQEPVAECQILGALQRAQEETA